MTKPSDILNRPTLYLVIDAHNNRLHELNFRGPLVVMKGDEMVVTANDGSNEKRTWCVVEQRDCDDPEYDGEILVRESDRGAVH